MSSRLVPLGGRCPARRRRPRARPRPERRRRRARLGRRPRVRAAVRASRPRRRPGRGCGRPSSPSRRGRVELGQALRFAWRGRRPGAHGPRARLARARGRRQGDRDRARHAPLRHALGAHVDGPRGPRWPPGATPRGCTPPARAARRCGAPPAPPADWRSRSPPPLRRRAGAAARSGDRTGQRHLPRPGRLHVRRRGARFGAGRTGHVHQGQDIVAAEGTPVVTPVAGIVHWRAYQARAPATTS